MSNVNVENLLYEGIGEGFEAYRCEELGSDKRKSAHSETIQLLDRAIELERIEADRKDKEAAREAERIIKEKQMKSEKRRFGWEIGVGVATTVANLVFTGVMVHKSMKFEKTDMFTSSAGKFFNKHSFSIFSRK